MSVIWIDRDREKQRWRYTFNSEVQINAEHLPYVSYCQYRFYNVMSILDVNYRPNIMPSLLVNCYKNLILQG